MARDKMAKSTEKSQLIKKRENSNPEYLQKDPQLAKTLENQNVNINNNQVVEQKMTVYENVWRVIFAILLVVGVVASERVYRFHNNESTINVPKGSIYDFWVSIVTAIIIGSIRYIIRKLLIHRVIGLLSEKRSKTPAESLKRSDQLCKWLFDFCYYSISTVCGYLLVKDQNFLPHTLGGSGSCDNLFLGYPYVPEIPYLRLFYLIQAGTHLYTFVHQIFAKQNDPKFYEYALHHGLAFFLIWFSYMMNFVIVGVVVLLIHDPGDVVLIAGRAYTDMKNRKIIINVILALIAYPVWVYTRNIVFATCILNSAYTELLTPKVVKLDEVLFLPSVFMIFMLSALAIMHTYWTFFLTKAAVAMISKGKDKNGYDS